MVSQGIVGQKSNMLTNESATIKMNQPWRNRVQTLRLFHWVERLGLPAAWQFYALLLFAQFSIIFTIIGLNYTIPLRSIPLHFVLLSTLVVGLYLLTRLVSRIVRLPQLAIICLAALLQFALLLSYLANLCSFYFLQMPLKVDIVVAHIDQLKPLAAASGLSIPMVMGLNIVLLALCIALCFVIFRRSDGGHKTIWFLLAFLAVVAAGYSFLDRKTVRHEPIHGFFFGVPSHLGPPGFTLFDKPALRPAYGEGERKPVKPRPLVLISIDSLRASSMQPYGNATRNMPFVNSLYEEKKIHRFDNVQSLCAHSYCGIVGMLSSRYWSQLDRTPDNIADVLAEHGYTNHFLLSGVHMPYFQLARHYGDYVHFYREGGGSGRAYANDDRQLLQWLDDVQIDDPDRSFLWFHLMDVHQSGKRLSNGQVQVANPSVRDQTLIRNMPLGTFVQRYHDGIRQSDDTIRHIFSWLEKAGMLEEAFIIITSDHGELLGENGGTGHGHLLFEEVTSIPLLVYDQQNANWPERPVYSLVDAAPSFLEAIDAAIPLNWAGIPVQQSTDRCAVPVEHEGSRVLHGVVNGRRTKYWVNRKKQPGEWISFPGPTHEVLQAIESADQRKLINGLGDCLIEPTVLATE